MKLLAVLLVLVSAVALSAASRRYVRDVTLQNLLEEVRALKEQCASQTVRVIVDGAASTGGSHNHPAGGHDHHGAHEDAHQHHASHEDHEAHHQHASHETHHSHGESEEAGGHVHHASHEDHATHHQHASHQDHNSHEVEAAADHVHHASHEDHATHHQHASHETHNSHENDGDVHVYIHTGVDPHKDLFHDNTWPGTQNWPQWLYNLYFNASCIMAGKLTGEITLRQKLSGGPTEFKFNVEGFGAHAGHRHALRVHQYGVIKGSCCCDIGAVFDPSHELHGKGSTEHREHAHTDGHADHELGGAHHPEHHEEHHELHHEGDGHAGEDNHGGDRVDGDLGEVQCDDQGILGGAKWFEHQTLVGAHTIIGRAIAIHSHADAATEDPDAEGDILGCCTVVHSP